MAHITAPQRYEISIYLKQGKTLTYIAKKLDKDKSTISREIKRNSDKRNGEYKPKLAERKYQDRLKYKPKKLYFTEHIKVSVVELLKRDLSPEQIVGYILKMGKKCVSHERIYQFIWSDKRKGGQLFHHLRQKERRHRKRANSKDNRGIIKDRVSIDERPTIVENRSRFGDLEADLIIGKAHKKALLTINDRASGMVLIRKINDKKAETVSKAINDALKEWIPFLHTITTDNGKEFAFHNKVSDANKIDYYFAHPYSSWERGSNENLNGLIRQYFKKNTSFNCISDEQVKAVETNLNNRPRKRFNFDSPIQIMNKLLNINLFPYIELS